MQSEKARRAEVLKILITLSLPTIAEQLLSTLLQYVDTAMVGHLGESATAAVSVTTTITWLVNSVASAVGVAVLAMISRAVGSGDKKLIQEISKQTLLATGVCGGILTALSLALSPFIPAWMGAEQSVRGEASLYFFIVSLPLIFRTIIIVMGAAIRATQDTKTPMLISMAENILNVVLNYILIYVLHLGVAGAAIGTAVSYLISGSLMFYAYRKNTCLYWPWESFRADREILTEGIKLGLPVLGTSIVSCLGYVVFAGMVSGMGTMIFAAHSIAVTAETIFYIPGYGLRTATSALIGASLGEQDMQKYETVSYLSVALTVTMMLFSGILLYFIAYPLMKLFTSSEDVARLGAEMLRLVAFSEPFFGLMIVCEGIFYGSGKTRYVFWVEAFSMWGIRIAGTFICVKILHLGLREVWLCMIADNVCKAVLLPLPFVFRAIRSKRFSGS